MQISINRARRKYGLDQTKIKRLISQYGIKKEQGYVEYNYPCGTIFAGAKAKSKATLIDEQQLKDALCLESIARQTASS